MGDDHQRETGGTDPTTTGGARSEPWPLDIWARSMAAARGPGIDSDPPHKFAEVLPWLGLARTVGLTLDRPRPPDDRPVRYLHGIARLGLRFSPAILLVVVAVLLGSAWRTPAVAGPEVFVPALPAWGWAVAPWLALLVVPLVKVGLIDELGEVLELLDALVVYGQLVLYGLGTLLSIGLVVSGNDLGGSRNVVFVSGYLFTLLLGALLIYDGMLRTETLFANLGKLIPGETAGCDAFARDLGESLDARLGTQRVRAAHVFALVFVSLPAWVWWTGPGPQNLDWVTTTVINVALDFFIVVVTFQFLVLNRKFSQLISDSYVPRTSAGDPVIVDDGEPQPIRLGYDPDHFDDRGGYRELGRFASRVNAILVLSGLYVVYRLYVQGGRAMPLEAGPEAVIWGLSYVMPVIVYAIVALVWLYYSFWRLHRKMATELARTRRDQAEIRIQEAPVWPVGNRELASVVSANALPVLLAAPRLFALVQSL